jgi:hypothetical protein
MSTPILAPAMRSATYPPDFRAVAEQEFLRLLKRSHPGVNVDLSTTWLEFYTLKSLTIPPFTQFPWQEHPEVDRALRQFLRAELVSDTLLDYFLDRFSFDPATHVGFYKAPNTGDLADEVPVLKCEQILSLYRDFRGSLESAYRLQLADYWTGTSAGVSRRELFIAEHKKALLLESEVAVEQQMLTTSQHSMLKDVLVRPHTPDSSTVQKHGVFHLALACDEGPAQTLPGAFVLTHACSLEPPVNNDGSLGEVLLRTEHQGLEGFDSLDAMLTSLQLRFNDATQRQVLLQNLSMDQRERVAGQPPGATSWRLSVMNGNVLQTLFDHQVTRQQADFSHLSSQARAAGMSANDFVQSMSQQLMKAAHLDNAFMLDRNDSRLIASHMPHWWSETDDDHQQRWARAAQQYGKAITELHQLCAASPGDAQAEVLHQVSWRENVRLLATAQLHMGEIQARTERMPSDAKAWIRAVVANPNAGERQPVDGKTINLDFMVLEEQPLADVMRIAPADSDASSPLVICTLNAPDSKVFRWYPNQTIMREQLVDNPDFARYLLRQLPQASRPVECSAQHYEQWLKYFRAGETFKHLTRPTALPTFNFGKPGYVAQDPDYLCTHHDLKENHRATMAESTPVHSHLSMLGAIGINLAMLFIPSPVLITMAVGVGMFKVWQGFRHIAEHDYKGAALEFICATGYLATAAMGKWIVDRKPFQAFEDLHSAPPLVRRVGSDDEEQISYLMSLETAPRLPELEETQLYDAQLFRSVQIDGEQYFVKKQPWLFGHCQLYRADAYNPDLLIGDNGFAVEDITGKWTKVRSLLANIRNWRLKQADMALDSLTRNWPESVERIGSPEMTAFENSYLRLAQTSNTDLLPEINDYCEGGSLTINSLLRANLQTPFTSRFLSQFYRLHEYSGLAFRAVMVSPAGLRRLTTSIGEVFIDRGIQSASITRWNAEQWSQDAFIRQTQNVENKTVYVIFDSSVAKKNLFTTFLGDHVAVAPSTPLQLVASRLVGNRFYVYFKRPLSNPTQMFSLYSGNTELML